MIADSPTEPLPSKVSGLPTVHDDELLYSIVARYGHLCGYIDAASANLDLFDAAFGHAASRLPTGLAALAARLPSSVGLSGVDLANRHTLIRYQCAFLPEASAARALSASLTAARKRGRPLCAVKKPLRSPERLRFCPDCLKQMVDRDQDLHWKRVHQLAIVTVCPEHGCDLRESAAAIAPGDKTLHPASFALCGPDRPSLIPAGAQVDRGVLFELARDAHALLQGRYPAGMSRTSGAGYAQMFRDLGYRRRSTLDWDKMSPAIQAALVDVLPALPGLATTGVGAEGWFVASMRSQRPGHADRVLIAALILRRIEAIEPRFWAALDRITGKPLLTLNDVA